MVRQLCHITLNPELIYLQGKKNSGISCELSAAHNQFTMTFLVRQFVCVMVYSAIAVCL